MRIIKAAAASQTSGALLSLLSPRAKDTVPPLGDIAESFYFDSAGVGRGNFIDFERDSGALSFFFLFFLSCHRGFRLAARKRARLSDHRLSHRRGDKD